jgi:hypothetical protein
MTNSPSKQTRVASKRFHPHRKRMEAMERSPSAIETTNVQRGFKARSNLRLDVMKDRSKSIRIRSLQDRLPVPLEGAAEWN